MAGGLTRGLAALAGPRGESSRTLLWDVGQETATEPCAAVGLPWPIARREAAFITRTIAHTLEFDDTHDLAVVDPGLSVISAALATAESVEAIRGEGLPRNPRPRSVQPPYALARVEAHGTVTLADLSDEDMRRGEVLASVRRVSRVKDLDLETRWGERSGRPK